MIDITFNEKLDYLKVRRLQEQLVNNKKLYDGDKKDEWQERRYLEEADDLQRKINSKRNEKDFLKENI